MAHGPSVDQFARDETRVLEQFRLEGQIAVLTGASRGLGRAMALAMAGAGADVALLGREIETLEPVAAEIEALGRRALALQLDVAEIDTHADTVGRIERELGPISILINNAGVNVRADSLDYRAEDWDFVTGVNLRGAFFFTQACGQPMRARRRGKVLNVCSMTCYLGVPQTVAYSAAKAGLMQITRLLAVEWAEHHIQVNGISPGWFTTEMTSGIHGTPREEWVLSRCPTGRFGHPSELVGAAVFLVSPAADYITGQVLAIDGGILAGSDWRRGALGAIAP